MAKCFAGIDCAGDQAIRPQVVEVFRYVGRIIFLRNGCEGADLIDGVVTETGADGFY